MLKADLVDLLHQELDFAEMGLWFPRPSSSHLPPHTPLNNS